ncbi:hypothetical protein M569_10184 [Genlisea aurea]|uniref:Protein kinase domain-containing protein n=1 Tax=Genlisea aurea TaxID=192259 RepID=S8CCB0_9LAMI|nr:hypothetical protein M569_10184 [Genlisea aurea]
MDSSLHLLFISVFFLLRIHPGSSQNGTISEPDYRSLLSLKREFVDLRGVLKGWNDTSPEEACKTWIGIKCADGRVVFIRLPWKGLGGGISERIGELKHLRILSLHDNALQGPLPQSLGRLPNLRGVFLFNNRLSGSVPSSIGNSPALQVLDLSNNRLDGFIPHSIASNSTRLYRLNLSYNDFSGLIPIDLCHSPSLVFIALQHNNISGQIPDEFGAKKVNASYKLQSLALDHNILSGKFPSSLSELVTLRDINLSHNRIAGGLPDELGSLSALSSLDLSNNEMSGPIPEAVGMLTNLSVLNLSSNRFAGGIPGSVRNIGGLTSLDFSGNSLTGEIPKSLANLSNLVSLDLSYNNLSGAVPSALVQRFNSSSFVGNKQLCGYSNMNTCSTETNPRNESQPSSSSSSSSSSPHDHQKSLAKDIIFTAAALILLFLLLICCVLLCCLFRKRVRNKSMKMKHQQQQQPIRRRRSEGEPGYETGGKLVHFDGPFVFTADDLLSATAEILGKSAYGTTYKAVLEDNNEVIVKRLREKLAKPNKEFENEVSHLGRIRHPNLLSLRAYYLGPKGEKLLVYDHISNGSLASFLHGKGPENAIPWTVRLNIAIGIARGLSHLHIEQNTLHGNLNSSSILLDERNSPKIADFGLSRLMSTSSTTGDAVATAGTVGYRAPELSKPKNSASAATTKTDVFSLGVIMLELLTGKSPGEEEANNGVDLPLWVASVKEEEWSGEVFDAGLKSEADLGDHRFHNTLKLAMTCVDPSPAARPEAGEVARKLHQTWHGGDGDEEEDEEKPKPL